MPACNYAQADLRCASPSAVIYRGSVFFGDGMAIQGHRIVLIDTMIRSKAFASLRSTSKQVILELYCRRQMMETSTGKGRNKVKIWHITNNGQIVFTYAEAQKLYGYTRHRFTRAIDELIEKGFIEVNTQGGLRQQPNKYTLIDAWINYGNPNFGQPMRRKVTENPGFQLRNKEWLKAGFDDSLSATSGTNVSAISGTVLKYSS